MSGPAAEQPVTAEQFHVTVTFRKDGPAVQGTWTDGAVALEKFLGLVVSHGSAAGVTITLWAETNGSGNRCARGRRSAAW
ncbi:hypothetical protein PV416_34220 [Streptomyces ipomoeae]|uniref:hypothetical protein n=1 Tax=Streptomyces ipomoeae TaxID=103232 RepID=UPI0029A05D71|nr:hypothetical protein [Streptomyces ipomoeae]MDX2825990.1 hypothetical protein [Streptomyces ipomoeae]MDX2878696.1 hypothetical protein [Streptomyces ipomoeae]